MPRHGEAPLTLPTCIGSSATDDREDRLQAALVDICKLHKAAGHQVWVYCQMTGKRNVQPRLKEILEREGLKVGIMRSDDVEPKEREEWIAEARPRVRRDDLLPQARQHWA